MVVEVGVGHGHPLGGVRDVQKTVQVVFSGAEIAREIAVVDPDVGRLVDADGVAIERRQPGRSAGCA